MKNGIMKAEKYIKYLKPQSLISTALGRKNHRTHHKYALLKKISELEKIVDFTGSTLEVLPKNFKILLLSTIASAGEEITNREALELLRGIIEKEL